MLVNGIPHGKSVIYNEKDEILQQANFKEGLLDGEMIIYEENKMKMKMNFKNNLQHGETYFYNKEENVLGVETYANGLKEGKCEWKDLKGNLLFTENYHCNKLNGEKLEYYENGKVKKRSIFSDGELTGKAEEFYKNGWKKRKFKG